MPIYVAIATTGRAEVLRDNVRRLHDQTRRPDRIIVIGAHAADVALVDRDDPLVEVHVAAKGKGLCKQRNEALERLDGASGVMVFFDDDLLPASDYLEKMEALFGEEPDLVGLTGVLLADGAQTAPIAFDEAARRLDAAQEEPKPFNQNCYSLYGCNMAFRLDTIRGMRFDETLPLYGWQEDVDFSSRVGRKGVMRQTSLLTGIHLGNGGGRTSGKRLGYSQVVNVVYLCRKGTMRLRHGGVLMLKNILANLARSIRPEPNIDRRGRLKGNIEAFADVLRGRVDPRRIESL